MLELRSDPAFMSLTIRNEAERLAGRPSDFIQRAAVHHHLYADSFGHHVYPLLAAHGSLWAAGYLRRATRATALMKWEHLGSARRRQRMEALECLRRTVGESDRRAFIETYHVYRLTEHRPALGLARELLPPSLSERMEACHAARRARMHLPPTERKALFVAMFGWHQERVLEPLLSEARDGADCNPLGKLVHPLIRLPFFPRREALRIDDFANPAERMELATRIYDLAEAAGWNKVEASLRRSKLMPQPFQRNSGQHFFGVQNQARRMLRQEFLAAC